MCPYHMQCSDCLPRKQTVPEELSVKIRFSLVVNGIYLYVTQAICIRQYLHRKHGGIERDIYKLLVTLTKEPNRSGFFEV